VLRMRGGKFFRNGKERDHVETPKERIREGKYKEKET